MTTPTTKLAVTSLPSGVLAHAFSFLGLQEFATTISKTCKTFKATDQRVFFQCARENEEVESLGPGLRLFMEFSARSLHQGRSRREIVDLMPQLRSIDLHCSEIFSQAQGHLETEQDFERELDAVLPSKSMSSVTELSISGYQWNAFQDTTATKIFAQFSSLQTLFFQNTGNKLSDKQLAVHLNGQLNLQQLSIRSCSNVRELTIDTIVKMEKLRNLNLAACPGIAPLQVERVLSLPRLTKLNLSFEQQPDNALIKATHEDLAMAIVSCGGKLTDLDMAHSQCSKDSLLSIARTCNNLRYFSIRGGSCVTFALKLEMEAMRTPFTVFS